VEFPREILGRAVPTLFGGENEENGEIDGETEATVYSSGGQRGSSAGHDGVVLCGRSGYFGWFVGGLVP
jgi:hypothetical protein